MEFLLALLTGLAAGTHTSTWGMYKDSPHEGFTKRQYFRSIVIGAIIAPIVWWISGLDLTHASSLFLLFGSTYALERLTLEFYKTFLRQQDQSKYFIPMQLAVFGKVVQSRGARLMAGLGYLLIVAVVGIGAYYLQSLQLDWPPLLIIFIVGSAGGWISAFGGAWKDAPYESFQIFKFFRSPAVAFFYAIITSFFTTNYLFLTLCGIGYTVASIETYKTFFFPSKPRGKFAGMPVNFPEMLQKRQKFIPLYTLIWLLIIIVTVSAFLQPRVGLL